MQAIWDDCALVAAFCECLDALVQGRSTSSEGRANVKWRQQEPGLEFL